MDKQYQELHEECKEILKEERGGWGHLNDPGKALGYISNILYKDGRGLWARLGYHPMRTPETYIEVLLKEASKEIEPFGHPSRSASHALTVFTL